MLRFVPYIFPLALFLWGTFLFNVLTSLRKRTVSQRAAIDVELKRRHELIPQLVDIVRTFSAHEKDVVSRVTETRQSAISACGRTGSAVAEKSLEGSVRHLFARIESYPDVKADTAYLALQKELVESEERIRFARQFYNDIVMRYNTKVSSFPAVIIARIFRFEESEYFEVD